MSGSAKRCHSSFWVYVLSKAYIAIAILNELWKNREEEIKEKTWKN
jgi:hypothetical protein